MDISKEKKINSNIAYLIFDEPLWANLLRRQVYEVIVNVRNRLKVNKYYLIAFLPWHHILRERVRIKEVKNYFKKNGIICRVLPIPLYVPVYNFKNGWKMRFTFNIFTIPLIMLSTLPVILFYVIFSKVEILHCRSYLISLPVVFIKLIFPKIAFVFDPRSDFPEERALQKKWGKTNINFRMWKYFEKLYCKYADRVIAIGECFNSHFKHINNGTKSVNIYNNVDTNKFVFNKDFRKEYRISNNIENKTIFCYSGTLQNNHWNDPELYAKFITKYFSLLDIETLFLFLIPEHCRANLIRTLQQYRIDLRQCLIESPNYTEIPKYLSAGDIAMYFLSYYSPRVGTKFVEYCSLGLPTVANNNVGGASALINKNRLGISLENQTSTDHNNEEIFFKAETINKLIKEKEHYRERCREFALNNFDIEKVSEQYSSLYCKLLK